MTKSMVLMPAIVAVLCGAVWGLMTATSEKGRWSRFPNQFEVRARKEREQAEREGRPVPEDARPSTRKKQSAEAKKTFAAAKAVVDETTFNFGAMTPFRRQRHTFLIRNEGTEDLTLRPGSTTCKCTACDVLDPVIGPGATGRVELEWKSMGRQDLYRHSATVLTNDPKNSAIKLIVEGSIRTHLGAEPPDLFLPRVHPLEESSASTMLYSQLWKHFTIGEFESSLPGVTYDVTPASEEQLKAVQGESGYMLKVTLPSGMESGEFRHWVHFKLTPDSSLDEEPIQYEINLEGKVLRRLIIHGEGLDAEGTIRFPPVNPNQGLKKRWLMKVNDTELELPVRKITCQPGYVQASVTSYKPEGKDLGLYYLDVEIPKGIPPAAYQGDQMGSIQLDFEHPRVEDLELKLEYVVSPPQ